MAKYRQNFTLCPRSINLLDQASKLANKSKSLILDKLILDNLGDQKKILKERVREYAIKINELQDRLKRIDSFTDGEKGKLQAIQIGGYSES